MNIFQKSLPRGNSRAIANHGETVSRDQKIVFADNRNNAIQRTVINEIYNAPNSASATVQDLTPAARHGIYAMQNAHFIPDFVGAPFIPQNMAVVPTTINNQMSGFEARARNVMKRLGTPFDVDYSVNVTGFDARYGNYNIPEHLTIDAVDNATGIPLTPQLVI